MYKLIMNIETSEINTVKKLPNGPYIPFDPANTDYQEYLQFLAEGGVPEPADE